MFIANESGRPLARARFPDALRVSIVTVAELRAGVLVAGDDAQRARRSVTLAHAMRLEPALVDAAVAGAWAVLRVALRDARLRMRANDAWIAATAIALGLPLVTQDRDFRGVPMLQVIHV
ncbi:MAG: PIN domain-containing protein [Trueperaceae bacterium]